MEFLAPCGTAFRRSLGTIGSLCKGVSGIFYGLSDDQGALRLEKVDVRRELGRLSTVGSPTTGAKGRMDHQDSNIKGFFFFLFFAVNPFFGQKQLSEKFFYLSKDAPPPNQHWQGHQLSALTSSRRASVPPRQSGGRASVRSTDHSGDITTNVKQRAYKHDSRRFFKPDGFKRSSVPPELLSSIRPTRCPHSEVPRTNFNFKVSFFYFSGRNGSLDKFFFFLFFAVNPFFGQKTIVRKIFLFI
ncbi:hypothetical protein M514_23418 [Trichuris suis]|uniref:Uncharacterized protein n=1 Tax=Trichuris suis TaxID=68888 RepID=A0A085N4J8_9BILA|nr:hypothetical protein M514_23418 [Trichuris suis]